MKFGSPVAFRRSLEDRLHAAASSSEVSVNRLRKLVALDRFLARLLVLGPDRWLVKGGVALELRLGASARATKDLDLLRRESEDADFEALVDACSLDLGDHFEFSIEHGRPRHRGQAEAALRLRLRTDVASRLFETVAIDVGHGGVPIQSPAFVSGPELLAFADIAPIRIPTLPLDLHVAEKLHAYTRHYGGIHASSRVKDLVDLVLISSFADFEGGRLRQAIEETFSIRGSHPLPIALPEPPGNWSVPYRELAIGVAMDPDLHAGYQRAARFLDPVLALELPAGVAWDASRGQWLPPSSV